jgi:hypothetical protein
MGKLWFPTKDVLPTPSTFKSTCDKGRSPLKARYWNKLVRNESLWLITRKGLSGCLYTNKSPWPVTPQGLLGYSLCK